MTIFEIATLILGSGTLISVVAMIFRLGKFSQKIDTLVEDMKLVKIDLKSIDGRLNHLEGAFFERGQWEAKIHKKEN